MSYLIGLNYHGHNLHAEGFSVHNYVRENKVRDNNVREFQVRENYVRYNPSVICVEYSSIFSAVVLALHKISLDRSFTTL